MRQDKLSFPEAVRALAKTAGVTLPEERHASAADSGREELQRVMDLAARFYADALWKPGGAPAREYLDGRGIDAEVARRFGLGYALDGWDTLLGFMRAEHVAEETLVAAGLVIPREGRSGVYDRFRGRLMFAIRDLQGRVVAFGGRAFGEEQPKYLNSPETPLYTKGNLLYAADLARTAIREKNRALLVEGYVDCLMAHQHGFTETVAALGTSFTPNQLILLRRNCDEVTTFFDADTAGQKAADRAEALLEEIAGDALWDPTSGGSKWLNRTGEFTANGALRVNVALLPAGEDPDTFLRRHGASAFSERIKSAKSIFLYALNRSIVDLEGDAGPRARANAFARSALMLAKVPDAYEAMQLSREVAFRLGAEPAHLVDEARRLQSALRRPRAPAAGPASGPRAEDRALVHLLVHHPEARPVLLPLLPPAEPGDARLRAIVGALRARPEAAAESLMTELDDAARGVLAALLVDEDRRLSDDPGACIADFRRRLERGQRLRHIRELSRGIAAEQSASEHLPHDDFRTLTRESKLVLDVTRGLAPEPDPGPPGPQGAETHE